VVDVGQQLQGALGQPARRFGRAGQLVQLVGRHHLVAAKPGQHDSDAGGRGGAPQGVAGLDVDVAVGVLRVAGAAHRRVPERQVAGGGDGGVAEVEAPDDLRSPSLLAARPARRPRRHRR
jgi:hypothetical protein